MRVAPRTVKSTALLAAAAAASSHSAMAADLTAKAGPMAVPAPSWQGLYVGGSVGASWLNSVADDSGALPFGAGAAYYGGGQRNTGSGVGWLAGLDIGYNWQDRNFVYGVEADISWLADAKATTRGALASYGGYTTIKTSRVEDLSTFRGRFGFDFDGTMPYVTFGVAAGEIKNSYTLTAPTGASNTVSASSWKPGLVLGAGLEHQFTNHWTLRGEVLWVGFKDTTMTPAGPPGYAGAGTVNYSNSLVLGRVGLNYKF